MEQLYFQVSHSKDSRKGAKNRKEIQSIHPLRNFAPWDIIPPKKEDVPI